MLGARGRMAWLRRVLSIVAVCAATIGCTGPAQDAEGRSPTSGPGSTADRPDGAVAQGVSTFVVGDEVWSGGGVYFEERVGESSKFVDVVDVYRRFDSEGEEVGSTRIDGLGDSFVFTAFAIAAPNDTAFLLENRCPVPVGTGDTGFGCGQPTPRLIRISPGGDTVIDLQRSVSDEAMLMTPVAATDDTLAIVAEPLNGSPVLSFINLDTGDATTTDLPEGVGASSVCGQDDAMYAVSQSSDNGIAAKPVSLHRSPIGEDAVWATLGTVVLNADAVGVEDVRLACAPSFAVWANMNQPAAILVTFDLDTGTGVEESNFWEDPQVSSVALCAGESGVVISGTSPDRQTAHYRPITKAGPAGIGNELERAGEFRTPPVGCPVGKRIVDASQTGATAEPAHVVR
jgi:hypothetical protein